MCLVTTLLQENGHCWHLPSLLRQHCAEYFLPNLGMSYITTLRLYSQLDFCENTAISLDYRWHLKYEAILWGKEIHRTAVWVLKPVVAGFLLSVF